MLLITATTKTSCCNSPNFSHNSTLDPTLSLIYIDDLRDGAICNIAMLMILFSILSVIGHLNTDLIYETLAWRRKQLVDIDAGKSRFVSFDWSMNFDTFDVPKCKP